MIRTARLHLRLWSQAHRDAFAGMNADPEVMADFGRTLSRAESDAKLDRYAAAYRDHDLARWAVEDLNGMFLGYAGVMPRLNADHPLGPHHEIGWRFVRSAWGQGFATEGARAALDHAFAQAGLDEILAYTAPDNHRSQAVMARLNLTRKPAFDFETDQGGMGCWHGLVWAAQPNL